MPRSSVGGTIPLSSSPIPVQLLETLTRSLLPRRGTSRCSLSWSGSALRERKSVSKSCRSVNPKDARLPYSPSLTGRLAANGHPTAGVSLWEMTRSKRWRSLSKSCHTASFTLRHRQFHYPKLFDH